MEKVEQQACQLVLPLSGRDKASFDNFLSPSNRELVATLKAMVQTGSTKFVFFYGVQGSGKSHLLSAVLRFAKQHGVNASYLSLQDDAINPEILPLIALDGLVCIDNIQHWAGDSNKERALFTLFEQVKHNGGQLVVTAKLPPEKSEFELFDLVSRLSSGLVYPLQSLDSEQQFLAIKMRAEHKGIVISDETVRYLLSRCSRSNTDLFSIFHKIDEASLIEKRKITIPFLQKVLNL